MAKLIQYPGSVLIQGSGVAAIQISYVGKFEYNTKFKSSSTTMATSQNKILIYSMGKVDLEGELFIYRGNLNITSFLASDWNAKELKLDTEKKGFNLPELMDGNIESIALHPDDNLANPNVGRKVNKTRKVLSLIRQDAQDNLIKESFSGVSGVTSYPSFTNTKSLTLDGTDDYANMGNLDIVGGSSGTGDFSVSAWFKSSTTGTNMHIVGKGNTPRWTMEMKTDNKVHFEHYIDASNKDTATSDATGWNDGDWHHCLVTADRDGDLTMYLDGSVQADSPDISSLSGDINHNHMLYTLVIGKYSKSASKFWNGEIDEVAIWDAVLSADDATAIYNSGTPNDLTEAGSYDTDRTGQLVAYWRLEGDYTDSSDSGNDGAAVNEASFTTDAP